MGSLETEWKLFLGVCLSAWMITADGPPTADNLKWVSLDFKTILTWTTQPSDYKYTVSYASDDSDWEEGENCIRVSETECDLTKDFRIIDRTYHAQVKTEPATTDYDYDHEEFPHTYSTNFNPYKESNISAVNFTVKAIDESSVIINITDTLTAIHNSRGKQLSLRDVLRNDLKYKISYYKSGSTGKRDITSDSLTKEVLNLEPGQSYCFMVAAFIPSRATVQQGAWSIQQCTTGDIEILQALSIGAWVGIIFILLTILIIIITVTVLCCKCWRQKNTSQQSSAPI
ncbi:tissue factor-like [Centropristis striata]|uniref:tissue factor-like n=1 Tax=Centropristis striata TaxID=184440 RepID=UPI0027E0E314|nr:tissue factor-like [Centropristis striata]